MIKKRIDPFVINPSSIESISLSQDYKMFEFIQLLAKLRNYDILEQTENRSICYNPIQNDHIQVFLCEESKLDMGYFYKSYDTLEQYNQKNPSRKVQHLIFIYRVATIQIKKLKLYKDVLQIEFFHEHELCRLLIGNRFIPRHTKVSKEEYQEIVRKFGKHNLPTLLNTDPIVRLYHFELDDIIQVERPDVLYYRLVILDE